MKVLGMLLVAAAAMSVPAKAEVRITNDEGGSVNQYFARYQSIRDSGDRVVIDGTCLSACTLVLGIVPPERVCATDGAMLGFHAAWRPNAVGGKVLAGDQTARMMASYPAGVRRWIAQNGGLKSNMIFAHGRALGGMVRHCRPPYQARLDY